MFVFLCPHRFGKMCVCVCVCVCDSLQLEDKRAEMERQLISMKVQYQSLQKQHAFSKQQLQRMKVLRVHQDCRTHTSTLNIHSVCLCVCGLSQSVDVNVSCRFRSPL